MIILPGDDGLEEGGLALGIGTGDGKNLPPPDPEAGDAPVARGELELHRIQLPRAGEGDGDPLLRPRDPVEASEISEAPGRAGPVANEGNEPHPGQVPPGELLVKGVLPFLPDGPARKPRDQVLHRPEEEGELGGDPVHPPPLQGPVGEGSAQGQVHALRVGEVPAVGLPEGAAHGRFRVDDVQGSRRPR
jgi:hypothetical protein